MTAANHNPMLRLASSTPPPWDDREFRWALRDTGMLADLKPAEAVVLWQAYCMANSAGEFDLPIAWVARQLGLSDKAVSIARTRLEARGLLSQVGTSDHSPQIGRYTLVTPRVAPNALPPSSRPTPPPPNVCSGDPGTCVPPTPEHTFPQRVPEKSSGKETAAASASGDPDQRGLFDGRPAYDAAAAKLLVRHCRMTAQEAKGYVGQYRPSAGDVRAIIANMAARDQAAARGTEKCGIRDRLAFTRACLRRGEWSLDDRVARIRATARRRAAAVTARRAQAREVAQRQHAATSATDAVDATWAAMPEAERRRLLAAAIAAMAPSLRKHYIDKPLDRPMVRAAILKQLEAEQQG